MEEPLDFLPDASQSWYNPALTLDTIPKPAYALLEQYSGLSGQELIDHVNRTRQNAWLSSPYPCVGLFIFLELSMSTHSLYPTVLSRLTAPYSSTPARLLDLGCGLGQDERKLVYDGIPADRIIGVDVAQGLIDAGYDLFRDRETTGLTFLKGDIFAENPLEWGEGKLKAGVEVVHVGAVFHLYDWEQQVELGKKLVRVMGGETGKISEDAIVFGYGLSSPEAGVKGIGAKKEGKMFGHSVASFRDLWEEIGRSTRTKWQVEVREVTLDEGLATKANWGDKSIGALMRFEVHKT